MTCVLFLGEDEEPEFVWEDYLQQTGTTAVPPTAFKHVWMYSYFNNNKIIHNKIAIRNN
jgi:hypothetical protein